MGASFAMSNLLAIAIVRRLLLELKTPEEKDLVCVLGQPIEAWVNAPVEDFGGWTPAQALSAPGGDDVVRSWLQTRLR